MSGIGIAKIDLRTLSESQREYHVPVDDDEKISSAFYWDFQKSTWYTQIPMKLRSTTTDETFTFHVNMNYDYLVATDFCMTLPAVRVKKDYQDRVRIAWTHNVLHNIIEWGQCRFEDDIAHQFDSVWLDIQKQFLMKSGMSDNYNLCTGSVPCLEDWNTFLPRYNLKMPLPFYYRREISRAIPLFLIPQTSVTHVFKLRNRVADVLRMQTKTSKGVWKDIPCNQSYLEGIASNGLLPQPDVWGYYAYTTDAERESGRCLPERNYYYEDIIASESINTVTHGQTTWVDLDSKFPCKSIFWVAQNQNALTGHYYSNYTTNSEEHAKGWNPCEKISLLYGGSPRLDNMDSDHFDKMSAFHFFPSAPNEPGYNGYSVAHDPQSMDADVALVFYGLKAKLLVTINNTDIFLKPVKTDVSIDELAEDDDDEGSSVVPERNPMTYRLQVRALVNRKITFKQREDKKYEVVFDVVTQSAGSSSSQ